ncbi:hypothetical protein SteCoe_22247 [Stentor coeruleus]|uniref:Ion transport domain-containing protein n=1 Tax=Stentor coeruleus TaxID=5963 RepID=A0A1R2BN96_9CILI|nr:hypothetical protein SteCoe_22247 [Stentor coeruleus]
MIRKTNARNTTVINNIHSQEELIVEFGNSYASMKKSIAKKNCMLKETENNHESILCIDKSTLLIIEPYKLQTYNYEYGSITNEIVFSEKIISCSCSSEKILISSLSSLEIYSIDLIKTVTLTKMKTFSIVKISENSNWAITSEGNGNISLWNLKKNLLRCSIKGHDGDCTALGVFIKDKRFVSIGADRKLKVWDKNLQLIKEVKISIRTKLIETSDELIVSSETVWIYPELKERVRFKRTPVLGMDSLGVAISPNALYLAISNEMNMSIYDTKTMAVKFRFRPEKKVKSMFFSKDNVSIIYSDSKSIWRLKLFEDLEIRILGKLPCQASKMVSEGQCIFLSTEDGIYLYDDGVQAFHKLLDGNLPIISEVTASSSNNMKLTRHSTSFKKQSMDFNFYIGKNKTIEEIGCEGAENTFLCTQNILFLHCNSSHLLSYDSTEIRVYSRLNYDIIYTYPAQGVKNAEISNRSQWLLVLFPSELQVHSLITMQIQRIVSSDIAEMIFTPNSEFVTISSDCMIQFFRLGDVLPEISFIIPERVFTGKAEYYKNYLFISSEHGIEISSMQDFTFLTTIPIQGLQLFSLSIKSGKIYYTSNDQLFCIKNPVAANFHEPLLLKFNEISYDSWQCVYNLIANEQDIRFDSSSLKDFVIMPYCITPIMILSNSNQCLMLKNCMQNGFKYLRFYNKLLSPITLAVCRKNKDVLNVLMKEIILASENDKTILSRVEEDIVELNHQGATAKLEFFYNNLFIEPDQKLPKIGFIKKVPFVALETDYGIVEKLNFIMPQAMPGGDLLSFKCSRIRFSIDDFTVDSAEFLESIICCSNPNIMKTSIIQAILLYKWQKMLWLIYLQLIFYSIYLGCLTIFVATEENNSWLLGVMNILNTVFLVAEIPLLKLDPIHYISDPWNILDSIRLISLYLYSVLYILSPGNNAFFEKETLGCIILLSWLRGLAFFRIFKRTRYLVRIIIEVVIDVIPFAMVLCYSIASIALVGYTLQEPCDKLTSDLCSESSAFSQAINEWNIQYQLNLGQFSTENYDFIDWMQFFGSTGLNTLIMMSMIIALMGNTFEKVEEMAAIADYKEMASYILEIESMFLWMNRKSKKKYFQFCYVTTSLQLGEDEVILDAKISKIKQKVMNLSTDIGTFINEIDTVYHGCDIEFERLTQETNKRYDDLIQANFEQNQTIVKLMEEKKK